MGSLSLGEAAETARTNKVDIWRAIREGRLSAQRTDDGGFAIDPAELFRVFETQRSEQPAMEQDAGAATEALGQSETSATPETAETNDIAVAFAALGAELKDLLGLPVEKRSSTESHQHDAERQPSIFKVWLGTTKGPRRKTFRWHAIVSIARWRSIPAMSTHWFLWRLRN
jgi:hypothetical protein